MDKVYIETSIVSHATAWPSRDVTVAGLQQQARDWWENERHKFELVTSQLTLDESADGDPAAAADRLKLLHGLPLVVTVLQHHTGCGLPSLRSRVQGRALFGFGFCGLASSFSTASFAAASFFALASRR